MALMTCREMYGNGWQIGIQEHIIKICPSLIRQVQDGEKKVIRGGSWSLDSTYALSTIRVGEDPEFVNADIGFRCVLNTMP